MFQMLNIFNETLTEVKKKKKTSQIQIFMELLEALGKRKTFKFTLPIRDKTVGRHDWFVLCVSGRGGFVVFDRRRETRTRQDEGPELRPVLSMPRLPRLSIHTDR